MPHLMMLCQHIAVIVLLSCISVHCQGATEIITTINDATTTTTETTTTTTTTTTATTTAPITTTKPITSTAAATTTQYLTTVVTTAVATKSSESNFCKACAIAIPIAVVIIIVVVVIIVVVLWRRHHKRKPPGPIPRPDSMDPFSFEQQHASTAYLQQDREKTSGAMPSTVSQVTSNGSNNNTYQQQNTSIPGVIASVPAGEPAVCDDELYLNSNEINGQLPVVRTDSVQSILPPVGQPQPTTIRDPLAPDTGPRLVEPPKATCGSVNKTHGYVNVKNEAQSQQSQQDGGADVYVNCSEVGNADNADPALKRYVNLGPILEHMQASRKQAPNQAEV